MATNLILSLSNETNVKPYVFKLTNIKVYSFEEALYHCYHYWKQSIDDFMSEEFIEWIRDVLKLSFIASKIKDLETFYGLSRRLTQFLTITDYFTNSQIQDLRKEISLWENRKEWEKLKERGDYLIENNDPEKAFQYYKKALDYGQNFELLNNIAISLIIMENYNKAIEYLECALLLKPNDKQISLHMSEAYILNSEYDRAMNILRSIETRYGEDANIYYLYGEINKNAGSISKAIEYYEKAIDMTNGTESLYVYKLSDVYLKLRFYDKAFAVLEKIKVKDKDFLKKQAKVHVQNNNIPAAIKCIEKALVKNVMDVDLWTVLAMYYRMDYDLIKANAAIVRALELEPSNEIALLESARIKKSSGKIKEYQAILKGILNSFKYRFRESKV